VPVLIPVVPATTQVMHYFAIGVLTKNVT